MLAGRMVAFSSLDGAAAGGRRRPRVLPPLRHQVESEPPALGRGRAARRRLGFNTLRAERDWPDALVQAAATGRAGLHQRARSEARTTKPAGERGAPGPGGGRRRGGALDPGLRHGRLLGHGEGSGDLRVLAGRGRQPGASRGVGPSRRLGSRPGRHRAVRALGRPRRRGIPDPAPGRWPRALDRLPRAASVRSNRRAGAPDGRLHRHHRAQASGRGASRQRGSPGGGRRPRRPRVLRGGLRRARRLRRRPVSRPLRHPPGPRRRASRPWSSGWSICIRTTASACWTSAQQLHDGRLERLSIEYRYLHPTRGERWLHHVARVTRRDASGRAVKTFGVLRDITERTADARRPCGSRTRRSSG